MFFSKNRRFIMNLIYGILGLAYGYFAYKYIFNKYEIIDDNYTKIMVSATLIFSIYYIGIFLYFRFISKSDFWEKRFTRTTILTMINYALFSLNEFYVRTKEIGLALNNFVQLIIISFLPSLVVWAVIFLLNTYKTKK